MNRRTLSFTLTLVAGCALLAAMVFGLGGPRAAEANNTPQGTYPFTQDWTNTGLISVDDDWSAVPGILGYTGSDGHGTGDPAGLPDGRDPQTITDDLTTAPSTLQVAANRGVPDNVLDKGVAEFQTGSSPVVTSAMVALRGSTDFDSPFLLLHLNTTGKTSIVVSYHLIDLDQGGHDAQSSVALQYRVGSSGNFTNIPAGFVLDASQPNQAGLDTPVSAALPADALNKSLVQVRIITANANGSDEWIGVDNIAVTANGASVPTSTPGPQPTQNPNLTHKVYLPFITR